MTIGRQNCRKHTGRIIGTILLCLVFVDTKVHRVRGLIKLLAWTLGVGLLIKNLLLDRFLACMKPASITLRPPCAGVFFWRFVLRKNTWCDQNPLILRVQHDMMLQT